MSPLRDILHSE